ncbi:GntR family transcriptional regulator [Microbacterium kribbense]|uniref:GntR family transcriptional regulator n=1 Tax=Microbacterium kribbense TaxID=433645 RepID=A0ABP7GHH8_9MICO
MTDTLTPSVSKSEQAYDFIRARITGHQYTPGYRLVLGTIADELHMSVVPVREAIRRLEAEGMVTFERNVGARVSVVDESEYVYTMETLGLVEGSAISLAAPLLTAPQIAQARGLNERMRRLLDHFDPHEFTRLNEQFHAILFEQCPNPHILDLVHRGWRRLPGVRDSTFALVPDRAAHSVEEHEQILRLIEDGAEALEVELTARNHRWRTLDAFLLARHHDQIHTDSRTEQS